MVEALKRYWWVPVIRGIAGIVFGVITFAYPALAVATLVLLFGAWVLIDGVFRIIGATVGRAADPDWASTSSSEFLELWLGSSHSARPA